VKQKGFLSILLIIVLAAVLAGSFYLLSSLTNKTPQVKEIYSDLLTRLNPTPTPTPLKKWYLKDPQGKTIYEFNGGIPNITHYQDWLLFPGSTNKGLTPTLEKYNLKTQTQETIFTEDETLKYNRGINEIQIINNTLFFTTGGYLAGGAVYYLDLPLSDKKPQLIVKGQNPNIEKIHDRYWILGGEGDACWVATDVSSFNPDNKQVTKIKDFNYRCGEGTQYIGIDKKNRILFLTYKRANPDDLVGYLAKIEAIHSNNPQQTDILISGSTLKDINYNIEYSGDNDQILLYEQNKVFLFDVNKNALETLVELPEGKTISYQGRLGDIVCFMYNGVRKAEVNLQTKTFSDNSSICQTSSYQKQGEKEFENFIQQLNLPPAYRFVYE